MKRLICWWFGHRLNIMMTQPWTNVTVPHTFTCGCVSDHGMDPRRAR